MIGEVGGGFGVAMETLDLFRPSVGAFAVGMAQAALDAAVAHAAAARGVRQAARATCRASRTSSRRSRRSIQAARLLVRDAAGQYDDGVRPVRKAAAMAKLFATETAQKAVDVAIQVHGAPRARAGPPARAPLP